MSERHRSLARRMFNNEKSELKGERRIDLERKRKGQRKKERGRETEGGREKD